jgi:hypothetical protein
MIQRSILFVTAALLAGCAAQQGYYGPNPQAQADQATANLRNIVLEPLRRFQREQPTDCNSQNLKLAVLSAREVESVADQRSETLVEYNQDSADLDLEIADVALSAGCLDTAENMYRHVIERYIGFVYAAYRQRAQIGIEDVRTKRASKVQ